MPIENVKKPRVYSVEFWRFAFTIIVMLYHLEIYYQRKIMPSGTAAVEFFFILAGFTIAMTAAGKTIASGGELSAKESHLAALSYLKKKLVTIYPLLALALIFAIVVVPMTGSVFSVTPNSATVGFWPRLLERAKELIGIEWEWLLMVGTPMGFNEASASSAPIVPLWFLTQLLVVGYLYSYLTHRKYHFMMFAAPLILVLGYTYFVMNSEFILDFYIKMGFLNAGTVRALAGMAGGIAMYRIYEYIKGRDWSLLAKILFQLLELFAIYRYWALTFRAAVSIDNFRRIPYLLIIVLMSFSNITLLSKLLNWKFMEKLGKLSLPMYLIHFPVAALYLDFVYKLKTGANARSLPEIILRSGGTSARFQMIPLSIGDILMYTPMVIAASLLMLLLVAALRKLGTLATRSARKNHDNAGR